MSGFRFTKQQRLLRASEFERVFAARCSAGNRSLVMYGAANELGYPRLGLTVSRKLGGAATRNRWKRVAREAFRLAQHQLPPIDLVCLPRGPTIPQLNQMLEDLPALAARIDKQLRRDGEPISQKLP
jgi:ribonuclease P protein component